MCYNQIYLCQLIQLYVTYLAPAMLLYCYEAADKTRVLAKKIAANDIQHSKKSHVRST